MNQKLTDIMESSNNSTKKLKKKSMNSIENNKNLETHTTLDNTDDNNDSMNDYLRDQGYTRPRILILCPFRSIAFKIVKQLKEIYGNNTTFSSYDKFINEYSYIDIQNDFDNDLENENESKKQKKPQKQSEDYESIFTKQNVDDDFKLGIQINPGQGKGLNSVEKGCYIRLYSDFLLSDIIIASPLGLRLIIEKNETSKSDENIKNDIKSKLKSNSDFLSSLEIVLLHQCDILSQQNFEHVEYILSYCNQLPKQLTSMNNSNNKNNATKNNTINTINNFDITRIREYYLTNNLSKLFRQLIITSYYNESYIQSLLTNNNYNINGLIKIKNYWNNNGILNSVCSNIKQIFQKVPINENNTIMDMDNIHYQYFVNNILKSIINLEQSYTLIITPSYFDFIKVRNELIKLDVSYFVLND